MPGHRRCVAQGKVDVLVTIDIRDAIPMSSREIERVSTGPLIHPGHRNSAQQVICLLERSARHRRSLTMQSALLIKQAHKACAVNRRHDSSSRYSHPIKIRPISCADARDIVET